MKKILFSAVMLIGLHGFTQTTYLDSLTLNQPFSGTQGIQYSYKFKYNPNGTIALEKRYEKEQGAADYVSIKHTTYSYDGQGRLLSEELISSTNQGVSFFGVSLLEYSYSSNNQISEIIQSNYSQSNTQYEISKKTVYEYDNNGYVSKISSFDYNSASGEYVSGGAGVLNYEHDVNGNRTLMTIVNTINNAPVTVVREECTYSSAGMLTAQKLYLSVGNNNGSSLVLRDDLTYTNTLSTTISGVRGIADINGLKSRGNQSVNGDVGRDLYDFESSSPEAVVFPKNWKLGFTENEIKHKPSMFVQLRIPSNAPGGSVGEQYYNVENEYKFFYSQLPEEELAVKTTPENLALNLYPNPVSGNEINIAAAMNLSGAEVIFYSVEGKLISSSTINGTTVDISPLEKGVYTVVVNHEGKATNKLLFVE